MCLFVRCFKGEGTYLDLGTYVGVGLRAYDGVSVYA